MHRPLAIVLLESLMEMPLGPFAAPKRRCFSPKGFCSASGKGANLQNVSVGECMKMYIYIYMAVMVC